VSLTGASLAHLFEVGRETSKIEWGNAMAFFEMVVLFLGMFLLVLGMATLVLRWFNTRRQQTLWSHRETVFKKPAQRQARVHPPEQDDIPKAG
jgi:hypothetical protein